MTIQSASNEIEKLEFVENAGAAPTDHGNIPCFQIKLTHASEMNDTNSRQVEDILRAELRGEFDGELVVQVSKDIIDEGTEYEQSCFWAFTFGSFGKISIGGVEYNIISWNPDIGVEAVPVNYTNPMDSVEKFRWSEVPVDPSDLEE